MKHADAQQTIRDLLRVIAITLCIWNGVGCRSVKSSSTKVAQTISIQGSDTMLVLMEKWADTYHRKHPGIHVQLSGGGSGAGLAALTRRGCDIAASSRKIKTSEYNKLRQNFNSEPVEIPVAIDAVSLYVHASNTIDAVTLMTLKDIYQNKIRWWSDLGGARHRIVLYSRENSSGTYAFFKEVVLHNEDFAEDVQTLPGTAAVLQAVVQDRHSMGYGGMTLSKKTKVLGIRLDSGKVKYPHTARLDPNDNQAYPLARMLYLYTAEMQRKRPVVKAFLDWIQTPEAQSKVIEAGFGPLR